MNRYSITLEIEAPNAGEVILTLADMIRLATERGCKVQGDGLKEAGASIAAPLSPSEIEEIKRPFRNPPSWQEQNLKNTGAFDRGMYRHCLRILKRIVGDMIADLDKETSA